MKYHLVLAATILASLSNFNAYAKDPGWTTAEWDRFCEAIHQVESNGGNGVIGDGGDSIGGYQIQRAYWEDAVAYDPSLKNGHKYEDCLNDLEYSKKIVIAYLKRYAPPNPTPEMLARQHNGGPKGHKKEATKAYAVKFKKVY